ncbi:MAG: HAD family hydrolase [Chloroflexota bacterium]|nr:HAD family hydrolase [Chloroflexota bacterium]
MIRLVALDLDGTLLDSQQQLSATNAATIARAKSKGIIFILATARQPRSASRFARELALTTPLICHNGAVGYRPAEGIELWHFRMDLSCAREIAAYADENGLELSITVDELTYYRQRPGQELGPLDDEHHVLSSNLAAMVRPPTRIIAHGTEAAAAIRCEFSPRLRAQVRLDRYYQDGKLYSLTMVSARASKGAALARLCREWGVVPEAVLAIGDGEADLEMFACAGLSVATGNAPLKVQAAADFVAPSNDEDGVAWAIERFAL